MNSREVIRRLRADGWAHVRTTGSHWHFRHPTKPGLVTAPHPKRNLPRGAPASIARQAGIKLP